MVNSPSPPGIPFDEDVFEFEDEEGALSGLAARKRNLAKSPKRDVCADAEPTPTKNESRKTKNIIFFFIVDILMPPIQYTTKKSQN